MRYPQIVVYESTGRLAAQVADIAQERKWLVRESRQPDACLQLLREGRVSVFLLELERQLLDELTLLDRVAKSAPHCPTIVASNDKLDGAEQRLQLAGLAYDLGASYVLFPPLTQSAIEDLVVGFMEANIGTVREEAS